MISPQNYFLKKTSKNSVFVEPCGTACDTIGAWDMICIYRDSRKGTDAAAWKELGGNSAVQVADRAKRAAVSPSLHGNGSLLRIRSTRESKRGFMIFIVIIE